MVANFREKFVEVKAHVSRQQRPCLHTSLSQHTPAARTSALPESFFSVNKSTWNPTQHSIQYDTTLPTSTSLQHLPTSFSRASTSTHSRASRAACVLVALLNSLSINLFAEVPQHCRARQTKHPIKLKNPAMTRKIVSPSSVSIVARTVMLLAATATAAMVQESEM